jgi:putative membrane protein
MGGADKSKTAAPTDPQIASIAVTANQVDIDAAEVAKWEKSKNKEVQNFASTMITDHESVIKQASALVKRLNVKPEDNPTSQSLKEGGKANLDSLKQLKGPEFDKAYVDHEVTYHQQVLDAVRNTLVPNAKNPELKALLEKTAPVIEAHLDHAKKLQTDLSAAK